MPVESSWLVLIWFGCSAVVFLGIAGISPKDRWLTKQVPIRILFVLGGPATMVFLLLFFIIIMAASLFGPIMKRSILKFFAATPIS